MNIQGVNSKAFERLIFNDLALIMQIHARSTDHVAGLYIDETASLSIFDLLWIVISGKHNKMISRNRVYTLEICSRFVKKRACRMTVYHGDFLTLSARPIVALPQVVIRAC